MRVLVIGAGKVGAKVLKQLKKNPGIRVFTVDPRMSPYAVEEGVIEKVDHRSELNQSDLKEVFKQVKPDLALVTTSAEDIAGKDVPGMDILVESLRQELEATATVPIIAVARTSL